MKYKIFIFLAILAGIVLRAAPVAAETPFYVEGIRYGQHGGKTRIVIDFSTAPDFRAFLLDKPYRLAVDLPYARWRVAQNNSVDEGFVKAYRSGLLEKEGLTRVIFDLTGPAVVDDAFVLPRDDTARDRLVIDLASSSRNLFVARTANVYGNRNLKGGAGAPRAAQSFVAAARGKDMAKVPVPPLLPKPKPQMDLKTVGILPVQKLRTVVIDAGHGGGDPGAMAFGVREKNITLAVAQQLKRQLEETGRYRVVLTRDKDVYIKLRERLDFSRRVGADLFVSVHADKVSRSGIRGASIYTLSETASDEESARLAEDENNAGRIAGVDLAVESADVADILLDLAMREKMNESNLFARIVAEALRRKNVKLLPNSHRSAGFAVLKAPDVPAILIETGFISNPDEAKLLSSRAFQQNIADAIVDGIDAYFRKMQALRKVE